MRKEQLQDFWRDERGRNMLAEIGGTCGVVATDPATRQIYVEAKVKGRAEVMLAEAKERGIITSGKETILAEQVRDFVLPKEMAEKMALSYIALASGYVGIGRLVDSTEIALYAYAHHQHSLLLGMCAFLYGRLAGSVVNYGFTQGTGKALGLDLSLQAAVSAIPFIGPIPAMFIHSGRMAATSVPEMGPISNALIVERTADKAKAHGVDHILTPERVRASFARIGLRT